MLKIHISMYKIAFDDKKIKQNFGMWTVEHKHKKKVKINLMETYKLHADGISWINVH